MNITEYQSKLQKAIGKKETLTEQVAAAAAHLTDLAAESIAVDHAQAFIQIVAQQTQEQLRFHIEDIVQLCLDTCFPDEYTFQILFEIKRGKTEARLCFVKDGHEIDPMDASGGGVIDLAAFALRIAAWSLGKSDNTIILDEPFRFLSKDLQPRAGEIMKELATKLNIQFILVTHNPDIIESSHRVFEVSLKDRESVVKVR